MASSDDAGVTIAGTRYHPATDDEKSAMDEHDSKRAAKRVAWVLVRYLNTVAPTPVHVMLAALPLHDRPFVDAALEFMVDRNLITVSGEDSSRLVGMTPVDEGQASDPVIRFMRAG